MKGVVGPKCLPSRDALAQGDSFEELLGNICEAVEGCLSVDVRDTAIPSAAGRIAEIAA